MVEKMILREKKIFFFLICIYRTGGTKNVYFNIICADVVYPPGESYPYLLMFAPIKDLFMHIM